jgi:hypothetical protein
LLVLLLLLILLDGVKEFERDTGIGVLIISKRFIIEIQGECTLIDSTNIDRY